MVGTLSREMSNHEEEELEQPGTLLELQETSNARFTGIETQIAQLAGLVQRLIPGGSDSARDSPQARVNAGGGLPSHSTVDYKLSLAILNRFTRAELQEYCDTLRIHYQQTEKRETLIAKIREHQEQEAAEDASLGSVPSLVPVPQYRQGQDPDSANHNLGNSMRYEPTRGEPIVISGESVDCKALLKEITLDSVRVFFKTIEEYEHRYQRTISVYSYLSVAVVKQLKRENDIPNQYFRTFWTRESICNMISNSLRRLGISTYIAAEYALSKIDYPKGRYSSIKAQPMEDNKVAIDELNAVSIYLQDISDYDDFIQNFLGDEFKWPNDRDPTGVRVNRLNDVVERQIKIHTHYLYSLLGDIFYIHRKADIKTLLEGIRAIVKKQLKRVSEAMITLEQMTCKVKTRDTYSSFKKEGFHRPAYGNTKPITLSNLQILPDHSDDEEHIYGSARFTGGALAPQDPMNGEEVKMDAVEREGEDGKVSTEELVDEKGEQLYLLTTNKIRMCYAKFFTGKCENTSCKYDHNTKTMEDQYKLVMAAKSNWK